MEKSKINLLRINQRYGILSLLVLLAAFSRIIPHPSNFAPMGAMALFGAAYFSKKTITFLIPILSLWLSDLFINNVIYAQYFDGFVFFYPGFYWNYLAFVLIGAVGLLLLKKTKLQHILLASLSASALFYLVSNFGVWASGTMYPMSFNGLITCYTAAIPFFKNTVMSDLVYCGVLFGAFEFAQYKIPALRLNSQHL